MSKYYLIFQKWERKVYLILLLGIFFINTSIAQNAQNYISISTLPLNFNLSTVYDLENIKTIQNAITLNIQSSQSSSVYLRVSNSTNTSGTPLPANKLSIQLSGFHISNVSAPVKNKIFLSTQNQLIIYDKNKTDKKDGDFYYYNLFLEPIGYDYAPGNYTFTLLFTLTQN